MSKIDNILDYLEKLLKWASALLLLFMLTITFIQVVMRYIFNKPFMWAEEVTLTMLIWFGYFTITMVVKEDEHMSIEFLYNLFNTRIRRLLDAVKHLLMICFSGLMVFYGSQMVISAIGKTLPASRIGRSILYLPLVISGALMALFSIVQLIKVFLVTEKREGGE